MLRLSFTLRNGVGTARRIGRLARHGKEAINAMRVSLVTLIAALSMALFASVVPTATAALPPCAVDEYGNCIAEDGYASEDAGVVYAYSSGSGEQTKSVWARRNYTTWFGTTLFHYYEQVTWSYRGGVITALTRWRWPADVNSGWQFDQNIGNNCTSEYCMERGNQALYQTTVMTQGQFHACAPPWDWACNYRYPRVSITVNAYGGWGYNTSG